MPLLLRFYRADRRLDMLDSRERSTLARRVLSREIVKVPRALAHRTGVQLARCQHALRPARRPAEVLRRELRADLDLPVALASLRSGHERRFFFDRDGSDAILDVLERDAPGWRERTIHSADLLCSHVVRLLGADRV